MGTVNFHNTFPYRGTSLIRKNTPLGPYSKTMPRAVWSPGGGAVSHERGTPSGPLIKGNNPRRALRGVRPPSIKPCRQPGIFGGVGGARFDAPEKCSMGAFSCSREMYRDTSLIRDCLHPGTTAGP